MGVAEGLPLLHQVVSKIGGEQGWVGAGGGAWRFVDGGVIQHGGHKAQAGAHGVSRVEEAFLVLLQVAVIRHGQAF